MTVPSAKEILGDNANFSNKTFSTPSKIPSAYELVGEHGTFPGIHFNTKDFGNTLGHQAATLTDALSAVPRWALNKIPGVDIKPLASNFTPPTDYLGKAVNNGLEWAGHAGSSAIIPGGVAASVARNTINYAPKVAKHAGYLASFFGYGSKPSGLISSSMVGGASAQALVDMGMNPIAANLLGVFTPLAPHLIKYGVKAIINAFRNGDVNANDLEIFNKARIASGEAPVKFGIADTKNGTFLSIKGAALKEGRAQEKSQALERAITENTAPIKTYFENGLREAAKETIIRGNKITTVPGEIIHLKDLVSSLYSSHGGKQIIKFGNSFKNLEDASHAVKSLINSLSPKGNYLEIASKFNKLPSESKKALLEFMPTIEEDKLVAALNISERMAPRLIKESEQRIIKPETKFNDIKRFARITGRVISASAYPAVLKAELAYHGAKGAYKASKQPLSNLLHVSEPDHVIAGLFSRKKSPNFPEKYLSKNVDRPSSREVHLEDYLGPNIKPSNIPLVNDQFAGPYNEAASKKAAQYYEKEAIKNASAAREEAVKATQYEELAANKASSANKEMSSKETLRPWEEKFEVPSDVYVSKLGRDLPYSGSNFSDHGEGVHISESNEYGPFVPKSFKNPHLETLKGMETVESPILRARKGQPKEVHTAESLTESKAKNLDKDIGKIVITKKEMHDFIEHEVPPGMTKKDTFKHLVTILGDNPVDIANFWRKLNPTTQRSYLSLLSEQDRISFISNVKNLTEGKFRMSIHNPD